MSGAVESIIVMQLNCLSIRSASMSGLHADTTPFLPAVSQACGTYVRALMLVAEGGQERRIAP